MKIKSIRSEPEDEKSNVEDSKATPEIRIRAPSENLVGTDGKGRLRAGPPWPKDIVGDNGELPEYVTCREQNRILKWVPWELRKNDGGQVPLTRRHRARIDLEIVVDGEIIDLNRIRLPKDTPINDVRVLD